MSTTTVNVTASDIKRGRRASLTRCPVALALRRVTGERWDVGSLCATSSDNSANLPKDVQAWIYRFDQRKRGAPVKPITFNLEIT